MSYFRFIFTAACLLFALQATPAQAAQAMSARTFSNVVVVFDDPLYIDANCDPIYLDVLSDDFGFNYFLFDVSGAAHGWVGITPDDLIVYQPDFDYVGYDSIYYEVSDDFGYIYSGVVEIIVQPPAPEVFADLHLSIQNNSGQTALNVLGGAVNNGFVVNYVSPAANGITAIDAAGTVYYTPPVGFVGIDTFTFQATDFFGTVSTGTVFINVTGSIQPGAVTANASASPTDVLPGDSIFFTAQGVSSNGGVLKYQWDFGDGTFASGQTVSHWYNAPGTYVATVTVTDSTNASASSFVVIFVEYPDYSIWFTTSDFFGYVDDPLIFNADAGFTWYADATFVWDFGDGTDGFDGSFSKVYSAPGDYNVSLTVRNPRMNTSMTKSRMVHVLPAAQKISASKITYKVKGKLGDSNVGTINLNLSVTNAGVTAASGSKVAFVFEGKRFEGTLNAKLTDQTNPTVKWMVKSNVKTGMLTLTLKINKSDIGGGLKRLVQGIAMGSTVSKSISLHIEIGTQIYEVAVPTSFLLAADGKSVTGSGNGP